ncbi:MAG: hypothetical protein GTN62_09520 [Gemmatimonadales bacterium]|nr:hypothetical protein [Gemmatimonadales bacterium]NIN11777.1 hypothetical protein [Gemmatimonadales bacterium]NIN50333.1 hypothetical protein [Gemmatimonadales bacterium]NIP07797.1 hypothetical protein [Gemmatimonadales bacterium]NIQ99229.1 hypothetical protein [Gemmatimonadales bacterium]
MALTDTATSTEGLLVAGSVGHGLNDMRILAIHSCDVEGFGLCEQYLIDHEVDYSVVHPYRDEYLPPAGEFDAILIGGTPMAAYDLRQRQFLQDESAYLQRALRLQVPCLGVRFGAQILAMILGADVRRCAEKEVGTYQVRLTSAGRTGGTDATARPSA